MLKKTKSKVKDKKVSALNSNISLFVKLLIIMAVCFIALSFLMLYIAPDKKLFPVLSLIFIAVSNFICGFYTGMNKRKKGLVFGVIYCLPNNLIILIASLIINEFHINYFLFITVGLMLAFSALGGIVSVNIKFKKK